MSSNAKHLQVQSVPRPPLSSRMVLKSARIPRPAFVQRRHRTSCFRLYISGPLIAQDERFLLVASSMMDRHGLDLGWSRRCSSARLIYVVALRRILAEGLILALQSRGDSDNGKKKCLRRGRQLCSLYCNLDVYHHVGSNPRLWITRGSNHEQF